MFSRTTPQGGIISKTTIEGSICLKKIMEFSSHLGVDSSERKNRGKKLISRNLKKNPVFETDQVIYVTFFAFRQILKSTFSRGRRDL